MHIENTRDKLQAACEVEDQDNLDQQEMTQKKSFKKPELVQHDALPQVTTGFFGSFP